MNDPTILPSGFPRRPLRPLHGIPEPDRRGRVGMLFSVLLHGIVLLMLFLPPFLATQLDLPLTDGGGGPGPAGGGGGGTGGTGGETIRAERTQYLQVAPAPTPPTLNTPTTIPPIVPPVPKPEPPLPEPVVQQVVQPPTTDISVTASTGPTVPIPGLGGGTGNDGTGGNGPGRGGGVGSGIGTGRGSGVGPGTGGGPGDIYPPQVTNLALLPIPVPSRVRPYKMIAWFDVDEKGNAKLIAFNPSKDGNYNRKIRDMLAEVRFRPAVRADGTPVRDTVSLVAEAPR